MSSPTVNKPEQRPLYASGTLPRKTGFFGLSLRATISGISAIVVCLLLGMIAGMLYAAIGVLFAAIVLAPMAITIGHRSIYEWGIMRVQWWRRRASGSTVYRSGPHSRVPGGTYRLPGVLARTSLHVGTDRLGNEFGMIYRRSGMSGAGAEYTVIFECFPGGDEALTQSELDLMTADWGAYLAGLGLPGDIKAAVVVVENTPATGQRLAWEVEQIIADSRSQIASQVMRESAQTFPSGRAQTHARLAITFEATTRARRTDPEEMATELARRLPGLYEDLIGAGVEATPMSAAQIVSMVHRSYNPSAEADFEQLDVLGQDHGLDWEDAGPATAVTKWGSYRHDGVESVVWELQAPPESVFPDSVLKPLLNAHDELDRKRVTLIYRPYTAGDATKQVDREYKDALTAMQHGKGVKSASAELRVQATEQARQEQVRGAGLVRYSALMTVTCRDGDDVATASAITEALTARSRLRFRRAYGQQDAAFAAALGVGLYLSDHTTIASIAQNS